MKKYLCLLVLFVLLLQVSFSQQVIVDKKEAGAFSLVSANATATILYDASEDTLVQKVAGLFQSDIQKVTGKTAALTTVVAPVKNLVIIGTLNHSGFIKQLIIEKKLNTTGLQGKWEGYIIQVVKAPFKGVEQALVIAGSDRRGAAYGALELSRQMGVSPWYYFADVPVKRKNEIYIKAGAPLSDAPKVKYRGIFLNDEAPALSNWTREKFGGFNHEFYEKVFELILRLKGNYLWPAMWGNAFNDDDKMNPVLANQWGIVMGTSHHEPMVRAQQEWKRFGKGAWNYETNDTILREFWKKGIQNMGKKESIVTVGMRGDGDEPMTQGTAIALLERIVADQRKILGEVTGKPVSQTPQLWALYKEVQDYYDKGMRVPDDITLLLCDDNWGNIRKLPRLTDKPRTGGYGIYYHFDYVGGPRNYKWINTNNIARVWEQMHLAWEYNARQIWIVNVGDLKPMEFPISFYLDYAWDPTKWNEDNLRTYYTNWSLEQFGPKYNKEIAEVLRKYSQYSARKKPELLDDRTYSLTNYNEADNVLKEWRQLQTDAEKINEQLPADYKDAYFQLVLHPIVALANLHEMYYAVAQNKRLAPLKSAAANDYAAKVKEFYNKDSLITLQYHSIAGGKWKHMMNQTHIGYTSWQEPRVNKMPQVTIVPQDEIKPAAKAEPPVAARKAKVPQSENGNVFYEENGVVSMEAANWTKVNSSNNSAWKVIPDIGRISSGISLFPVTVSTTLSANSPKVEYSFYTYDSGKVKATLYFSPSLNFNSREEGLQYAVSIDDETPQVLSLNKEDKNSISGIWNTWVSNNTIAKTSEHNISKPGKHILKYWSVSAGVVLQKLVVDLGGLKPSYLGPTETINRIKK